MELNKIYHGDSLEVLKTFPSESIDCIVTSPPYYGLRDYGVGGQIGQEKTPQQYTTNLMNIMNECKRVLKKTGSCWVNIGDSYDGNKSLIGIPERFAINMTDSGWIRRNTIIWYKPNCMPSSTKDRFTVDFEYFYFFTKQGKYYFETQYETMNEATKQRDKYKFSGAFKGQFTGSPVEKRYQNTGKPIETPSFYNEKGRLKRSVWKVTLQPFKDAHFAVFPEALIEIPVKACCPINGVVLDPFMGSGSVGVAALKQNKNYIGIELNTNYIKIAEKRIKSFLSKNQSSASGSTTSASGPGFNMVT